MNRVEYQFRQFLAECTVLIKIELQKREFLLGGADALGEPGEIVRAETHRRDGEVFQVIIFLGELRLFSGDADVLNDLHGRERQQAENAYSDRFQKTRGRSLP
jgi:hypothetical protein